LGDVEKTGYCPKKEDTSHFLYFWLLTKKPNIEIWHFLFYFRLWAATKTLKKNSIFKLLVFNFTFWQNFHQVKKFSAAARSRGICRVRLSNSPSNSLNHSELEMESSSKLILVFI